MAPKNLEAFLEAKLYHRQGRSITLTNAARQLLPSVERAFDELVSAVRPFSAPSATEYISCSTVGAFAARWLVPRLHRWIKRRPDIDIRISATGELVGFDSQGIDLAIRLGTRNQPGLYTKPTLQTSAKFDAGLAEL